MTANPSDDAGCNELRRLVYVSRSQISGDATEVAAALAKILETARRRNAELGVTGALVLRGGRRFAQVLEGEPDAVQAVFDSIAADPRHGEVTVTEDGPVAVRAFPGWSMAYVGEAGGPDIPLTLVDAVRAAGPEAEMVLLRLRALAE